MDTTLRYVQQFGRSKRDNLKPSLLSKYHLQQSIEVYPFRMMDFGCFASTTDGLSGLLHNSEMTLTLQQNLQEMIDKSIPIQVRINKYDRRTGEVAFTLDKKDSKEHQGTAPATAVSEATSSQASATDAPVATVVPAAETTTAETTAAEAPAADSTASDLEPFQFTISQPVHAQPETPAMNSLTERLNQELADIQKFLETVIKTPLSAAAQKRLRELLQQNSIFRFTYSMQTVVDDFEPDVGLQLVTAIERVLNSHKK